MKVRAGGRDYSCYHKSQPSPPSLLATEVRTHGVGYYQFSQDQEQRQEQLTALGRLREQVGGAASSVGGATSRYIGTAWNVCVARGGGGCLSPLLSRRVCA